MMQFVHSKLDFTVKHYVSRCGQLGYTKQTFLSSPSRYVFVHITKHDTG